MKKILIIIAIIVAGVIIWLAAQDQEKDRNQASPSVSSSLEIQGEEIPILSRDHVPEGTKVTDYNSDPPTSGKHWPAPAEWGFYDVPLPDERVVHNLEHGGIWMSYNLTEDSALSGLRAIARKYNQAVIVTPRPQNDSAIALASWGRLEKLDAFDADRIETFIKANINNSPEPFASLEAPPVAVGNPFPKFTLTEVDGTVLTNESFLGKPSIMWFTTEFCVPCQIGAREVSKLDDELGGDAFDVLVVFVDPRETEEDLRSWRERFARDDWMVAFDNFENNGANSLSAKVGLKYLDSKYLLDKDGIIQNIDFQIANDKYLDLIRGIVESS